MTHTCTGHRCDIQGCGDVMILDGNMKNNREVCFAVDAGYAEFSGLPGRVRTGCPNTPAFKSRYCPLHAPLAAIPHGTPSEEKPGIIIDKRVTRNSTSYQVTCSQLHVLHVYTLKTILIHVCSRMALHTLI